MQANFYILSPDKKPLDYTGKLAQAVLNKSDDGLAIYCPEPQLATLDDKLWSFSDTAFIPHNILNKEVDKDNENPPDMGVILTADSEFIRGFDGNVINLTDDILATFHGAMLCEIISHDKKELGREKYRRYHHLGWQVKVFNI